MPRGDLNRREVCEGCLQEVSASHIQPVLVDPSADQMAGWKFLCQGCRRKREQTVKPAAGFAAQQSAQGGA